MMALEVGLTDLTSEEPMLLVEAVAATQSAGLVFGNPRRRALRIGLRLSMFRATHRGFIPSDNRHKRGPANLLPFLRPVHTMGTGSRAV
jgi:hypothetical protein